MNKALSVHSQAEQLWGMCVAGLGALGVSLVYILLRTQTYYLDSVLVLHLSALFARVGGGIYTKAMTLER